MEQEQNSNVILGFDKGREHLVRLIIGMYHSGNSIPDIVNCEPYQRFLKIYEDNEEAQKYSSEEKIYEEIGRHEYFKNQLKMVGSVLRLNLTPNADNHLSKKDALLLMKEKLNQTNESAQTYFDSLLAFDFIKMKGDKYFITRDAKLQRS